MTGIDEIQSRDLMTEELITVEKDETVSDAIGKMRKNDISEIMVVEGDEVVGVISDDMFIKRRHLPLSTKVEHVMTAPPHVDINDSIIYVSEMMFSSGFRAIPVTSDSGYVGLVSRTDIVKNIPDIDELRNVQVSEYMTPSPSSLGEDETIGKAKAMMKQFDVRTLPVVDEYGRLSGMIGISDILGETSRPISREEKGEKSGERESPFENLEVKGLMTSNPITTMPDENIQDAARKMGEEDISTLVAVEDGDIRGILTQVDLVEFIASFRESDQVYVQITGLEERPGFYDEIYDLIQGYLKKINKVLKPLVLNVHVVMHKKGGNETKYSVRLRLSTDHGMLYAKDFDWNVFKALDSGLETLRKRVFKEKEKREDQKKHPKYSRR